MTEDKIVDQFDELLRLGEAAKSTYVKPHGEFAYTYDRTKTSTFAAGALAHLERVFGSTHTYFDQLSRVKNYHQRTVIERAIGIVTAARKDVKYGWLTSLRGLVSSEIFSDFLEGAEHLHREGWFTAAAVTAGSVLEEHLRQLCLMNAIEILDEKDGKQKPKRADGLNSDLCKAGVYNSIDQKLVTGWLAIRNSAAHGKVAEFNADQVDGMIQGILAFIGRHPL